MRKYIILFITILCVIENSYGVKNMEISTPVTTSQTHAARDYIRLKPGFSFNSTGNKAFRAYIDEHLLEPASLLTGPAYPNRSLNTSYAVGTIAGEASVSPTGAAIYQIPIEVMPGTGGIQPNVSVVYNSQSGNGVVGYAWNLGGISAITRTGKTLYHDGDISVPQLTNSDNLMLDGQRLMRASGSNLLASSTYRTEIETYLDITCKTLNSYLGFEVKNKEGWTMEYGSSADSYIKPKGGSTAYAWLLKKVTDANGNYMTYTYDNDASTGEFRLKQIDYTGNSAAGMAPYNKIEFFYETRPDISTSYIAGKSIRQSVVLKRIKCSAYGSAVREYKFNYHYDAYDLFYFKLSEIEEYGQNGLRYNSTIIHWGDYGSVPQVTGKHYSSYLSETRPSTSYPLFADFDGDGRTDLFSYDFAFTDAKLYLSAINSIGDVSFQKKCTTPLGGTSFRGFLTGDFNGDGKMDLARISSVSGKYKYEFFLFNGSQFVNSSKSFTTTGQTGIVGDFNGDGKMEILVKETKQVFDANGTAPIATGGIDSWGTSYLYCFANNRYLCDFNGNGKTDILVMNGTSCWVYELSGDTFVKLTAFNSTDLKNTQFPYLGDFNGDGKTDILVQNNNLTISTILFSTGAGFEKKTIPSISTGGAKVYVGNYNQDAQSDILFLSAESTRIRLTTGFFNGAEFMLNSVLSSVMTTADLAGIPALPYEQQAMYYVTGDFNGDGRSEFCLARHSDRNLMHTFTDRQNLSVRMIKNGLNNSVSFEYNPLSNTSCYTPATASPAFPVCKIQPALFVVKSMTSQAGSLTDTQSYSYKNARAHRQGKGFLGFEEITASSSQQGKSVTTQYGYNTTSFNTYPVKQTVKTTLGGLISETTFSNSNYTTGVSKVIFPYVSSQTAIDRLTGITRTTAYTYSAANHGNPDRITGTQGSLVTETTYTWEAKNSPYKNRMTQQVTVRRGLTPTFSETKKFEYDSKARLTKQIDYYGHSQAVTTAYSNFDNFGNARTVTAAAADCPPVTTSSVFDATGRFVISNTDALGNVSSAKYDAVTGVLLEKTDIAGLKTEHQYDGFQQLVQTDTPFDKVTCSTSWDISGNNLFKTETQSLISGTQTTWYNAAKQEIKTQIPGFSGTVVSGKEYNAKGQLYRSYLPGYGSKSSQFVEYEYDTYGRITKEINIGRTTSHSYNGLTTTVTMPNGTARSSTLNTSGLTASTKDEAGNTVTYTYNSLGKPVAITSAGAVTSITYDDRGFQKTLKDANMANPVQYAYNAYGQLASQTNARGQATTMTYDAGGRITQKVSPERTLNYEYVLSGNGIGQIKTIKEGSNSIIRSYEYTSLGQISSLKERIEGSYYPTNYTYDTYGQVEEKQSPSGLKVRYQYNNGRLTAMRNAEGNTLLWQARAINALGQITESVQGNGLRRVTSYDSYHLPSQIQLKNGTAIIDHVSYTFNATTGNLTSRNDVSSSLNESFGYDNLNRLTSITLNPGAAKTISYKTNGNINSKSDVGTYQYANSNHAVSSITSPAAGYTPEEINITNTSYNRVFSISKPGSQYSFMYNCDNERSRMIYSENGVPRERTFYVGDYEKKLFFNTPGSANSTKHYDYIYTPEGLTAIALEVDNGGREFFYVNTDHLGSVRLVMKGQAAVQTRYTYDAWGKQTLVAGTSITDRGYTGHEHLPKFGLINMNARMYDPVLGRFLEMDPYVQMPDYSQSFNRYSYALNNPLKYTDPTGEFIVIDSWISGFFRGMFQGKNPIKTANQSAMNDIKIWGGLFKSDPKKNFGQRFWEIASRFTWQMPQTLAGFAFSQVSNLGWQVDKVEYWGGATVLSGNFFGSGGAVTLGSYINGGRSLKADPHNSLFQHEYGHYLQSQAMGWAYFSRIGIPSIFSAGKNDNNHDFQPFEQDANRRAFMYFNKNVEGFYKSREDFNKGRAGGWDFWGNPLDVSHTKDRTRYYDYYNSADMALVNSLSLSAKWYDYLDPSGIIVGIGNGLYYNKHRIR